MIEQLECRTCCSAATAGPTAADHQLVVDAVILVRADRLQLHGEALSDRRAAAAIRRANLKQIRADEKALKHDAGDPVAADADYRRLQQDTQSFRQQLQSAADLANANTLALRMTLKTDLAALRDARRRLAHDSAGGE